MPGIVGFLAQRRAVAAVEFAILAPVLLVLAGGVVEIGALLRAYAAVNRVAMQYAVSYADCADLTTGTCQTELTNYASSTTLANIAPQLMPSRLTLSMAQVVVNAGSSVAVQYSLPSVGSLTAAQTSAVLSSVPVGHYGVAVTVSYQYSLQFFSTLMAPIIGSSWTIAFNVAQLKD